MIKRDCAQCHQPFEARKLTQMYCSNPCRVAGMREKLPERAPKVEETPENLTALRIAEAQYQAAMVRTTEAAALVNQAEKALQSAKTKWLEASTALHVARKALASVPANRQDFKMTGFHRPQK